MANQPKAARSYHNKNIEVNFILRDLIQKLVDSPKEKNDVRMFKVRVDMASYEFVLAADLAVQQGGWKEDYDRALVTLCKEKEICYLFLKLDDLVYTGMFMGGIGVSVNVYIEVEA